MRFRLANGLALGIGVAVIVLAVIFALIQSGIIH
jgi:hypothetical protein